MSLENDIQRDIIKYLGAHYGLEPEEIHDDSTLEALGVDSLGVIGIADIVDSKYGLPLLQDERVLGVRTLSDFKALLALKSAEMAAPTTKTN